MNLFGENPKSSAEISGVIEHIHLNSTAVT